VAGRAGRTPVRVQKYLIAAYSTLSLLFSIRWFLFARNSGGLPVTRERFSQLVEEELDALPEKFARLVKNVAGVVENEPNARGKGTG